jgi:hypothetical protein
MSSFGIGYLLGMLGVSPKEAVKVAKSPEVKEAVEKVVSSSAAVTAASVEEVVKNKTVTAKVSDRIAVLQAQLQGSSASSAKANAERSKIKEDLEALAGRMAITKADEEERARLRKANIEYMETAEAKAAAEYEEELKKSKGRKIILYNKSSKGGKRRTKRSKKTQRRSRT